MPDLTELQELAEDAGDGYMEIKADTAKKLIAVALAGDLLANGIPGEGWLRAQELRGERMAALRTALEELK